MFTREELEEMRRADEEIEASFRLSPEDLARSHRLDRAAVLDGMDGIARQKAARNKAYYEANREKVAARNKAYREANREKVAAQQKAYREANREKVAAYQKAYREANREKYNAYHRNYNKRKRNAASGGKAPETAGNCKGITITGL